MKRINQYYLPQIIIIELFGLNGFPLKQINKVNKKDENYTGKFCDCFV